MQSALLFQSPLEIMDGWESTLPTTFEVT